MATCRDTSSTTSSVTAHTMALMSRENIIWGAYSGAVLASKSLVLYGQTLEKTLPLIELAAAWTIIDFAQVLSTTVISAYALDCFPHHTASASSWINFWRTIGILSWGSRHREPY